MADERDDPEQVRLSALVSRRQSGSLPPPMAAAILPCGDLAPPVFERLVGETMWLVDGMNDIRGYGRSGQDQGGLDLIGRKDGSTHVYQVRRIRSLSATALRKAVADFAGPARTRTPQPQWTQRRFEAVRFVLAVGCKVDDTAVENELVALQEEYEGDLRIDLYDAGALTRFLRERPSVVGGVFGPQWAMALYGLELPAPPVLPSGYALLNDPLEHLGLSPALARAETMAIADPLEAAVLIADLVEILLQENYRAHAEVFRVRRRELLEEAGEPDEALALSAGILMDRHDDGLRAQDELVHAERLARACTGAQTHLYTALRALDDWYVHGYDLEPVVSAVTAIVHADLPLAGRILLAVAEQVVVDDDPLDNPQDLQALLDAVAGSQPADIRIRMQCCSADLTIRAGTQPGQAYADLASRALGGRIPERFASLVLMRQGRALAMADEGPDALEAYRRAVLAAIRAGLGADARCALRSISMLSHQFSFGVSGFDQSVKALQGARTIGSREQGIIHGVIDPVVGALEELVDNRPRGAVRMARRWLWKERLGGALMDEKIARRRLGEAWELAELPRHAVGQYVLAGEREKAVAAATKAEEFLGSGRFLEVGARWVRAAAAAVLEAQGDLVPDDEVDTLAHALADIVLAGPPDGPSASDPVGHATGALAALGHRLPQTVATRILPTVLTWLPREPQHYRYTDQSMLMFLSACTEARLTEAGQAVDALWEAVKLDIHRAEAHLAAVTVHHDRIEQELRQHAGDGNLNAAIVLASWHIDDPAVENTARELAAHVLAEPVGTPRNGYEIGDGPALCAALLAAATAGNSTRDTQTAALGQLRIDVAHHLLSWAQDHLDTADRRTTALRALAQLASTLPRTTRTAMVDALIAVHDHPGSHTLDDFEQRSRHPLSTFTMTTDAQNLRAAALHAAAECATTPEQAATVERLTLAHASGHQDNTGTTRLCAQTLRTTDLLAPVPLHLVAAHRAAPLRQCAVICWARRPHEAPDLAQVFAQDANTAVRVNLAHVLSHFPLTQQEPYGPVLDLLREDRSARVRQAATGLLPSQ
ncbi:hypothetical protein SAMN05216371_0134 [Streptomyces sp. TLI_053]|uniref:hypothetical protein n=1 Tax=Streptomyces sp. TLI_053 TaxID=1855352 RepID=UPI00087AD275|nr:hypothetical protein [Streptomyces sp. TLI_053]SDS54581.1 hypothetical protein SAMN05216371_0134 [Streptomyces sp. TLI_053]